MSDFYLSDYKLNHFEKAIFPVFSIYSVRHFKKASQSATWNGKSIHILTGLVEMIPLLGAVISLFEKHLASKNQPAARGIAQGKPQHKQPAIQPGIDTKKQKPVSVKPIPASSPIVLTNKLNNPPPPAPAPADAIKKIPVPTPSQPASMAVNVLPVLDPDTLNATAQILKTQGFITEARDAHHENRDGQTLSEVQGSADLCKKVVQMCANFPSALGIHYLRRQEKVNSGLFRILQFKRLGHAFTLKGFASLPDKSKVNLEGFNETFTIPMLAATFDEFAEQHPKLIDPPTRQWMLAALRNAATHDHASDAQIDLAYDRIHDHAYPYPVLLGSGWDWHSTQIIFYKDYMVYCNRGADSSLLSGISFYRIPDKSLISKELLKNVIRRVDKKHSNYQTQKKLSMALKAKFVRCKLMKTQKTGNCTYASLKAAIYALLVMKYHEDHPEKMAPVDKEMEKQLGEIYNMPYKGDTDPIEHTIAFEEARPAYKEFARFDRKKALEDFLIDVLRITESADPEAVDKEFVSSMQSVAQKLKSKMAPKQYRKIKSPLKEKALQAMDALIRL